MPEAPSPITSPPPVDGQPWDATDKAPSVAGWTSVDEHSGPASWDTAEAMSRFEDGPGPWRQT